MGTILSSKMREDGKVVFEVLADYEEAKQLKGHMENVFLFSDKIADVDTHISERGKQGSTKYFLIPKSLRNNLKFDGNVKCQKIDFKNKTTFIYMVEGY